MATTYELCRYELAENDTGIFGTLYKYEEFICETFELPWANNAVARSCIPQGLYECEVVYTQKFGRVPLVKDVPGRTDILLHIGNFAKDTTGCILVGNYRQYAGLRDSKSAMGNLLIELPDRFKLNVTGIQ